MVILIVLDSILLRDWSVYSVHTRQNCPSLIAPSWHSYYTKNTHVYVPVYLHGRHIPQTVPDIWTRRKAQPPLLAWGGRAENGFLAQADDQRLPLLLGSCTVVDHTPQWSLPLWSRAEPPGLGTDSLLASLSPSSVRRLDMDCDYTPTPWLLCSFLCWMNIWQATLRQCTIILQSHFLEYFLPHCPHMHAHLGSPEALNGDQDTTDLGSFIRWETDELHH